MGNYNDTASLWINYNWFVFTGSKFMVKNVVDENHAKENIERL